jgi:hypothetical protein
MIEEQQTDCCHVDEAFHHVMDGGRERINKVEGVSQDPRVFGLFACVRVLEAFFTLLCGGTSSVSLFP